MSTNLWQNRDKCQQFILQIFPLPRGKLQFTADLTARFNDCIKKHLIICAAGATIKALILRGNGK